MSATRARKRPPKAAEEEHVLDSVERLKAVADPMRIRFVLELLNGPKTVKEVAEALDVPPTRLYYHLRILEQSGLVEVATRRMVSGIEERSYRAVKPEPNWTVPATLMASALYESGALRAMFDMVRSELEVAVQGKPDVPLEDPHSPIQGMSLAEFDLGPGELEEFRDDFQQFLVKWGDRPAKPNAEKFRLFFTLYPLPTRASAPAEDEG